MDRLVVGLHNAWFVQYLWRRVAEIRKEWNLAVGDADGYWLKFWLVYH